jgi:outer membrane protein assembly factor BamD
MIRSAYLVIPLLALMAISCSTTPVADNDPAVRIAEARKSISKRQYQAAITLLENLRLGTAGTAAGGEVVYLLGRSQFGLSRYEEADSYFSSYLAGYPDGEYHQDAMYMRAASNRKQIEKTSLGFFRLNKYIPSDRDSASLRRTRLLYEQYLERYPDSEHSNEALEMAETLLEREGEHQLEVAAFYFKKKEFQAALTRANIIITDGYPEKITDQAVTLAEKAKDELKSTTE